MSKDQLPVTEGVDAGARRRYSETERRQIVEETYAPGACVSVVARRHDVNANLVFKWRQRYGRGSDAAFLPVAVQEPGRSRLPALAPRYRR